MKDTGERAFPSGVGPYGGGPNHAYGMTLRDYFAGQALVGVMTSLGAPVEVVDGHKMARGCYALADAMMAEREKPSG